MTPMSEIPPDESTNKPATLLMGNELSPCPIAEAGSAQVGTLVGDFPRDSTLGFMANHQVHQDGTGHRVSSDRAISLQLRQPNPDAICPISMDNISTSEVSGFEGFQMDSEYPTFTEALLECGHSFSACYLVVAWLTSSMRCPLCRAGIASTLDISSIPIRWKETAEAHVERFRSHDREEQENQDHQIYHDMDTRAIFALQIHVCVYFTFPDGSVQAMVVNFLNTSPASPIDHDGVLCMRVPRAQIRAMSRVAVHQNAANVHLVVFARKVGQGSNVNLVEVADSGPLHVPVSEPCRSSMVTPTTSRERTAVPVRDVVIVHNANLRRQPSAGVNGDSTGAVSNNVSTFCMRWQVYPNRVFNTLTDVTFSVKFSELAEFIGDMILEV
jgi:hypothetical protein